MSLAPAGEPPVSPASGGTAPGFVLRSAHGRLAAWSLGADRGASCALSVARAGRRAVLFHGRLFYVDDLRRRFGEVRHRASPAAIVLEIVSRGGERALEHLEGEYCLVLWDAEARTVTAARDPLGANPLFWSCRPGWAAVSTSIERARDPAVPGGIRRDYVADYLTRPLFAQSEPADEGCAIDGVQRVVPGTLVTLGVADGSVRRRPIWDWRDRIVDPGTVDTGILSEQARDRVAAAVRERLDGRVAAHFSGGMDSTSVAILAQREGVADGPVHGLSLVWDEVASLRGETRYVEIARRAAPGIVPHTVPADRHLSFDSFNRDLRFEEPYPGLVNVARDDAVLEVAARLGARTVLSGDGGDDVLDIPPLHIAEAIRQGRWGLAWREAGRRAHAHGTDVWGVLREYGLAHVLPLRWSRRARAVALGVPGHDERSPIGPWIRPDFARRHQLEARVLEQARGAYRAGPDIAVSAALAAVRCKVGDPQRWTLASPRGLWLSHPFQDPRVICFGLGIRRRGYRQDPTAQKPILAQAMRDVLPPEISGRVGKAHLNEVYFRGLARNQARLSQLAGDPAVEALGVFDMAALRTAIRRTALSAAWTAQGLLQLNLALSLTHWLAVQGQGGPAPSDAGEPLLECEF